MGEQLKVLDVARNLIRLSGFVPDDEIPITFVGLRPGEKLTEELVGAGETLEPAGISKISRVLWRERSETANLASQVDALVRSALHERLQETIGHLRGLVPTFNPSVLPVVAPTPEPSPALQVRRRLASGRAAVLPTASPAPLAAASAKSLRQA